MQTTKTTGKASKGQTKVTTNKWKEKAIVYRKEKEYLKKRLKEVIASRENWKAKYKSALNEQTSKGLSSGEKAARHQYSLMIVQFILSLYQYGGMSLRSCRHCLTCLYICQQLSGRIPSVNSIRNWSCKAGIHRVRASATAIGDYVIYVDESITFGSDKILLILGVELEKFRFGNALTHEDVEVLYVGISKEWTGKAIKTILDRVTTNKKILYVVSDEGRNLVNAYKLLNYSHIKDCTHKLSNYIKRLFEKDPLFESFRKLIGQLRKAWNLSKTKSKYMPPSMRGKLRFANIFPCVNWAKEQLNNWGELPAEIQSSLSFLKENEGFIKSLMEVEKIFKMVCKVLKTKGFGIAQKQELQAELAKLEVGHKANIFFKNCQDYLLELTKQQANLGVKNLLCTSDIIESYFGKFKYKVNTNSPRRLSEFIYTIAIFGKPFSIEETKQALENIKCKHLKLSIIETKAA